MKRLAALALASALLLTGCAAPTPTDTAMSRCIAFEVEQMGSSPDEARDNCVSIQDATTPEEFLELWSEE
ncbi:hypothetical protein BMW26_07895 [Microbacterium sp. 1.5R]|uniref:hypothetical protein n=1 Tax=Microbacterium sp. 1.5R TaxID=1916917 RepID=UPI00090C2CC7|nr:hypothetical protein [Microbacterium sp. 1.5R]APH44888.1 hypothetical protein BMW26_07895 [Microbacterium sp. 1.5R]